MTSGTGVCSFPSACYIPPVIAPSPIFWRANTSCSQYNRRKASSGINHEHGPKSTKQKSIPANGETVTRAMKSSAPEIVHQRSRRESKKEKSKRLRNATEGMKKSTATQKKKRHSIRQIIKQKHRRVTGLDGTDDSELTQNQEQPKCRRQSIGGTYNLVDARPQVRCPPASVFFAACTFASLSRPGTFTSKSSANLGDRPDSRSVSRSNTSGSTASGDVSLFGHRDTLARLYAQTTEDDPEEARSRTGSILTPGIFNNFVHRDTLARLHFQRNHDKDLPQNVLYRVAAYLQPGDYKNMRLTCRRWSERLSRPIQNLAQTLPSELLSQILMALPATDYDAARHTCRNWFQVGLDIKIASIQLKSSGSYGAYMRDVKFQQLQESPSSSGRTRSLDESFDIDHEWLMSKRNGTESRLSARWRGSSIRSGKGHAETSFNVVETVDFGPLLVSTCFDQSNSTNFTVSGCGKYMLLHAGQSIYIYDLCRSDVSVTLLAHLVAERRIISASMDTSSGRLAVAAILDGRLGALWDLRDDTLSCGSSRTSESFESGMRAHILSDAPPSGQIFSLQESPFLPANSVAGSALYNGEDEDTSPGLEPNLVQTPDSIKTDADSDLSRQSSASVQAYQDRQKSIHVTNAADQDTIRPSTKYKLLGTERDSPRSVAICPQRKCIAFGCKTGIELHWVDGTTFTHLNRWVPLHTPSDHLYFLPQRPGIDSARKLRLISSADASSRTDLNRRDSSPTRWRLLSTSPLYGRVQSMTRLFFGSLPFPGEITRTNSLSGNEDTTRRGVLRTVDCDHYRAVPISDGSHILFTEPGTGLLCLGSDAPLGGPTKLTRKVCMVPPPGLDTNGSNDLLCYRAGSDLSWGVRVVSARADGSVILYNIPVDCFEKIRYLRSAPDLWDELAGVLGQSDLMMDVYMTAEKELTQHDSTDPCSQCQRKVSNADNESRAFRSLLVDGQKIYHADSRVEDIQVDCSNGGITIWLFQSGGKAVKLSIYTPRHFMPTHKVADLRGQISTYIKSSQTTPSPKGKSKAEYFDEDLKLKEEEKHVKFVVYD